MIEIALWIIAICEVIRMLQNGRQLHFMRNNEHNMDKATDEFIKSMKKSDRDMFKDILDEYDRRSDGECEKDS